jgi:hypothetical protein
MNTHKVAKVILLLVILLLFTPVLAASTASWSAPVNLTEWQPPTNEPWMLLAPDGTQAVFWMERDITNNQESLWARLRSPGAEWSPAQNIFGWVDYTVWPELEVDPDSTFWAVWIMQDKGQVGDNWQVKAASWSTGGPWQVEVISDYETEIGNIDLYIGPEGHLAATWVACATLAPKDQGPCDVRLRRRFPGANVWEPIDYSVDHAIKGVLYGRSMVGPGGFTVVTWAESSQIVTNEWHVMSRFYDPITNSWEPTPVDVSGGFKSNLWPFLAQPVMGFDGTVIAAWYMQDPADFNKADLYSATRSFSTGIWNVPVWISNVQDAGMLSLPKLAVGENGTAVAVWDQKKASAVYEYAVFANVRDPGKIWGGPIKVSDYMDNLFLAGPKVWPDGSIVLLWEVGNNTLPSTADETLFWSVRSPAGAWGDAGSGQLGEWYDRISGKSLGIAHDGSISVVWGVVDSSQLINQRGGVLAASWHPGDASITSVTLISGFDAVEVSERALVVGPAGMPKSAAWAVQKPALAPTDPSMRVYYAEVLSDNTPPTPAFTIAPASGTTSTNFLFDASACNDNEDPSSVLDVRWDWENDGAFDTGWSTTKTISHQYHVPNTYQVRLQVRDTGGLIDSITKEINVTSDGGTLSKYLYLPITIR